MTDEFDALARVANQIARDHGFWTTPQGQALVATKIALIHEEVSEVLRAYRKEPDETLRDRMREEFADIIIRIMDLADYLEIEHIMDAVREKIARNAAREFRHGDVRL